MLKPRIIPCLDVNEGRVVKGIHFENLVDAGDPVSQAKIYDKQGADELCFLDITASSDSRNTIYEVVSSVADVCFMPLTVGGGVKTLENIRRLLMAGADKISINSAAISNPELIQHAANRFGSQCIVVAIDAKLDQHGIYKVFTHGGRRETSLDAIEWAKKAVSLGAGEVLLTSMDRDGTKEGFDLELTAQISSQLLVPVIASGGVGKARDFSDGITIGGASGLLAASVFHFGTLTIEEVKRQMQHDGIAMRIERDI